MLDLETLKDQTPAIIDITTNKYSSSIWKFILVKKKTKNKKTQKTKKDKKEKKRKQSKQASIPQNLLVAVNQTCILIGQQRKVASLFPSRDKGDIRHLKNACNSLVVKKNMLVF